MSTAPSFGKVTKEKCCHARSKYKHDNGGVNLLIEFSGDERVGQSFSFHRCYTKRGYVLRHINFFISMHVCIKWDPGLVGSNSFRILT